MWFKNLKLYRLAPNAKLDGLNEALQACRFQPCGSQDGQSSGWTEPREDSPFVYQVGDHLLITLRTERRLLPASVINLAVRERALQIEEQQGFKPGRKQTKEIKEQVITELLPKAFVTQSDTFAWLDTVNGWFVVDASSSNKSDEVLGLLAKSLAPFPIVPLLVEDSPAAIMTGWIADGQPDFEAFTIDQDSQLESTGESRATVRYTRQTVDIEEARHHIEAGKQCTRLAMTWRDRISFVLTDDLSIKRVAPLDVLRESSDQAANEAEQFDADFALMTGELSRMLSDLTAALGGMNEVQP